MRWADNRALVFLIIVILVISYAVALPTSPSIQTIANTTKQPGSGQIYNGTGNDSDYPDKAGGYIFTIGLTAETQNPRWKAFVGNITGTLVLDDADGYSIYEWSANASIGGEVYATRTSGSVSWSSINCSTLANISVEELVMNHTNNPDDNISKTFGTQDNQEMYIGSVRMPPNTCYTTNTFQDGAAPVTDDWEELLLHDGTNMVYATRISDDDTGYATGSTYDFQIILPEMGTSGWTSSTAYYFYVELS